MDYKNTLNLPKTNFPMKANLPIYEPNILKYWEKINLYNQLRKISINRKKFILHDGPPYANGYIHIGTALNKILKDFIIKSHQMKGYNAIYIPGWDCHGLPIEHEIDKQLGAKKQNMNINEIRQICRSYAEKFVTIQRNDFIRLGILGDWNNPYLTSNKNYEATIAHEFANFYHSGYIYQSKKPLYWCKHCRTTLADAEIEYNKYTSPSIYVAFTLIENIENKYPELKDIKTHLVIWTTTPWTIPANLAIAIHPNFSYAAYRHKNNAYIIATELAPICLKTFNFNKVEQIININPYDLEKMKVNHPIYDKSSLIVLAKYISLENGTGLVHIAPGHGNEDYNTALQYGLEIYSPIDDCGHFTNDVKFFAGQDVFEANHNIIEKLQNNGNLLSNKKITHAYPHCWRCKQPVISRATDQWFISMKHNDLRLKSLNAIINNVNWIPKWGQKNIHSMIEKRSDWCISRQRIWGVPIIIFKCKNCGKSILTPEMSKRIVTIFKNEGTDTWFSNSTDKLLGPLNNCNICKQGKLKKSKDILDVWFDSGVSHTAVLKNIEQWPEVNWPADMYLEGIDQHRGWFNSSLLCSIGTKGQPPYKTVFTHGFVVDGKGHKMSKSLNNVITPHKIINRYGAEILRLWVAAENFTENIRISEDIIKQLVENYRRIRNTIRFLLGNLYDFNPENDIINLNEMRELDQFILHRLEEIKSKIKRAYNTYSFHEIYHELNNFCSIDLSGFYLDIIKDRIYTCSAKSKDRRSAQTVLYRIVIDLVKLMAPIFSFTAEEIWQHLPYNNKKEESVHLLELPEEIKESHNENLAKRWKKFILIRNEVNKIMDKARKNKLIGSSIDATLSISIKGELKTLISENKKIIKEITMVSNLVLFNEPTPSMTPSELIPTLNIEINPAKYPRCIRCWMRLATVGSDKNHPDLCHRCLKAINE